MKLWQRITPALYGITAKVATQVVRQKWEYIVVPALQDEDKIYQSVFVAFAIAYTNHLNAAFGIEIFKSILNHEGIVFWQISNSEEYKELLIPNAVFDIYWSLAEDDAYWTPSRYGQFGQQIAFQAALDRWSNDYENRIIRCEERLVKWPVMN